MLHMDKNSYVCQGVLYNFTFTFRFLVSFFQQPSLEFSVRRLATAL